MSGIAGWADRRDAGPGLAVLEAMTAAIAHRGPDGSGSVVTATGDGHWQVALGQRWRASRGSPSAAPAMEDGDGRAVVVFDGVIDNLAALRAELDALGHRCRSAAAAEVLLAAGLAWGPECVMRLHGIFAFALWDRRRERLVLARDRFGKKPLHLWRDGSGALVFASEIKALLAHPRIPARLDPAALREHLTWGCVPGPHTLFQDIVRLPPAAWAVWEKGRLVEVNYWAPPDAMEPPPRIAPADPVAAFTGALDEAVRRRMTGAGRCGAFLSGGLGSSAVVALMSRHAGGPLDTFSVGFAEPGIGDLTAARQVAARFHTAHREMLIHAERIVADLPLLTAIRDAPVAEPAEIAIFRLAAEAGRTTRAVLTGEGADELLGGAARHVAEPWGALYRRLVPERLHRAVVEPLADVLPDGLGGLARTIGVRAAQQRLPRWSGAFSAAEASALLALAAAERPLDPRPFLIARRQSVLRRVLAFDQLSWLPDTLLERSDRLTMAAAVEARLPFVDPRLAALVAALPESWRVRGLTGKRILRRAMVGILPAAILTRPERGLRPPLGLWFRSTLRGWVDDLLMGPDSLTRDWYRRERLGSLIDAHVAGHRDHAAALWTLVTLELFQRQYRLSVSPPRRQEDLKNAKAI
ncbi:MAG: asparagine synthase (glutamine-hydrolyzing) [Magnetospirillum sp.]|nr:asparagine synthase (glutamine-hydrolyzing) [Magnetospirillum sp.]